MPPVDLNLLIALDALLTERSVTIAARRLGLSASAMSRTLARLRVATGDPLLVQAGRSLVPTPYAEAIAARVHTLTGDTRAVLSPAQQDFDPATLCRGFTIRANEGFLTLFAASLVAALTNEAPHVRLRFTPKPAKDAEPLRDGRIDLEIGTTGASAPEMRSRLIARDQFVGVASAGHPLFDAPITPERYAAFGHVVASRRGSVTGPVDHALHALGLTRQVVAVVPGFPDAITIAARTDLIALVPQSLVAALAPDAGLRSFALPVATPELAISVMWHPRLDADPAHRWMRGTVIETCRRAAR